MITDRLDWSTSEACAIAGVSPRSLQVWDETGTIVPARNGRVRHGTARRYSDFHLVSAMIARELRKRNLVNASIRRILHGAYAQIRQAIDGTEWLIVVPYDRKRYLPKATEVLQPDQVIPWMRLNQGCAVIAIADLVREFEDATMPGAKRRRLAPRPELVPATRRW